MKTFIVILALALSACGDGGKVPIADGAISGAVGAAAGAVAGAVVSATADSATKEAK